MLKNYLRIALRNLHKRKGFASINIAGLAIGMASFIFIALFVQDELSYDDFHAKGDRIYRIAGEYDQGGDSRNRSAMTTYVMKRWLDASFPDIQSTVRLGFGNGLVRYEDKKFQEKQLMFADPAFFDMFSFELIQGDPTTVIDEPNKMVISETIAGKYLGEQDPIGKIMEIDETAVTVAGVMKPMPHNNHFHSDFVISMQTAEPLYPKWVLTNATGISHYTYVELKPGVKPEDIEKQLADFMLTKDKEFAESRTYFLQPMQDIHLHSDLTSEIEANGDIMYIYVLSVVALIILLMACINYMNLSIAGSASRTKEIGIRKVVGAGRRQLIAQFLGESVILAFLALILSVIVVEVALPFFNALAGKSIQTSIIQNMPFLLGLLLLSIFIGVLAGSYPALLLSGLKSVHTLKSKFVKVGRDAKTLRKGLVVVQFAASAGLLVSTLVIYHQLTFMQNKKLGVNPEMVLVAPFQTDEIADQFVQLRTRLLQNPNVLEVAASNNQLTSRVAHWREYELEGQDEPVMLPTMVVTHDFFRTLQGEFVAGRDFNRDFRTDTNEAYILNEAAVRFLGLDSPVGAALTGRIFNGSNWSEKQARIIGVVKDFHLASLHREIQPVVFSLSTPQTTPLNYIAIRLSSHNVAATLREIEDIWHSLAPERPMLYTFMEQGVRQLYQAEARFLQVFLSFSVLAIAVACLGLLGISLYSAVERTKEMGIRKVLGASTANILRSFGTDFLKLVLVANVLAWPVAYYFMQRWLENFAYRIDIAWWTFALAGGLALLIALVTVSWQAIRVALVNPVESLRYE